MGSFGEYSFFVVSLLRHSRKRSRLHRDRLRDDGKWEKSDPDCIGTGCATEGRKSSYVGGEGHQDARRSTVGVACALRCGGC